MTMMPFRGGERPWLAALCLLVGAFVSFPGLALAQSQKSDDQDEAFEKSFGITDEDFDPKKQKEGVPMGDGPYLGMPMKFTVLLSEKQSGTSRFLKRFLDAETPSWQRWNLPGGSKFLGISMEALKSY